MTSSDGYTVHIEVEAEDINPASQSCNWGYNYNVELEYEITFSGNNIPNSLYTLQGTVGCGLSSIFFDLPNGGGDGDVESSNAWTSNTDCDSASPESLSCNTISIQIEGPGISYQTLLLTVEENNDENNDEDEDEDEDEDDITSNTGPGGVGTIDGESNLKLWYKVDNGVNTSDELVDTWQNSVDISDLDLSESGGYRPELVEGSANGYNALSFDGTNRIRTELNLSEENFVVDEASSFTVCMADVTNQSSCVYTTDPLVGNTRFSNHIPWQNKVYFDFGHCCGSSARIQINSVSGLSDYSVWAYDAHEDTGKQLYRNGELLQSRSGTSIYNDHDSQRFNIGGKTSGTNGFIGDITEVIVFREKINTTQRIIIENYLAAKYGLASAENDFFTQDNEANGNYDHAVAGIGQESSSDNHLDAQGSGMVRINNASDMDDDEYLIWGHNNGDASTCGIADIPEATSGVLARVWRVSETGEIGTIDMSFDLSNLGDVSASDLQLLIDLDNDGVFSDETEGNGVISGAISMGDGVYKFSGVSVINDGLRFTLGTSDSDQTVLQDSFCCADVDDLNLTISAQNDDITTGQSAELSVDSYSNDEVEIEWESSSDNISWSTIVDEGEEEYTSEALSDTTYFRANFTLEDCSNTSNVITIAVSVSLDLIWSGAVSFDWETTGNWVSNILPGENDQVIIPEVDESNFYPKLGGDVTIKSFELQENATVDLNECRMTLTGDFLSDGEFDQTTGEIKMNGTESQSISGSGTLTFNDLTINNESGVTLNQAANFRGEISPKSGVFDLNDQEVILLSTEEKTGSIGRIYEGADVEGDITLQRYFPASGGSWRMVCAPFDDVTFEQWNDDLTTTGFEGADYPTYPSASNPWSNIRYYDETRFEGGASHMDTGFVSIGSVSDPIINSKGYFIYMVPAPTTIDITGQWHKGSVEEDLDYTDSESLVFNDGWNLVSNPYPSAIDWDASMGWDKTDLDNAIYMYDPVNKVYGGYVNGIEINGATAQIASSQAFWVKSSTGNPSIIFDEKVKTNLQGVFFKSVDMETETTIRIQLESDGLMDEMVIAFNDNGTFAYDGGLDLYKMHSQSSSMIGVSAVSLLDDEQKEMSVCVIPIPEEDIEVDINITKGSHTEFTITNSFIDSFDENICLLLEDKEMGTYSPFNSGDSYQFIMGDSSLVNRFSLKVSAPVNLETTDEFCLGADDGLAICQGFGDAPWTFTWFDADDTIIQETSGAFSADTLSDIEPGMYFVTVENQLNECASATKVFEIYQAYDVSYSNSITTDGCNSQGNGEIQIHLPEKYSWNVDLIKDDMIIDSIEEAAQDTAFSNLEAGIYHLQVNNQCGTVALADPIDLHDPDAILAEINMFVDSVNLSYGGTIAILSNAEEADSFIWDFGDGETEMSNPHPYHNYISEGEFEITLTMNKGNCTDTDSASIIVFSNPDEEPIDVSVLIAMASKEEKESENGKDKERTIEDELIENLLGISTSITPDILQVQSTENIDEEVSLKIYNSMGQTIVDMTVSELGMSAQAIDISNFASGVFFLEIHQEGKIMYMEKIMK